MPGINKVYLIGFMGSGKTTTGMKLAGLLGWPFTDLDKSVEERCTMTIPEIFAAKGEDYFRSIESDELKKLEHVAKRVISTGGGAPCYHDNMDFMVRTGLTIYLELTPGQLKSRLSNTNGERPLINGLSDEELSSYIIEKLASREKWYKSAEITVNGFDTDIRHIFSLVSTRLTV